MRAWCLAAVLVASVAGAAPTVPKAELAQVPEAWRADWAPFEAAVDEARAALAEAQIGRASCRERV